MATREIVLTPPVKPSLRDQMLAAIPGLRAFAISLSHDSVFADDLVQETLVRAWANLHRFEPGSNMEAWLFTILRNGFYSHRRIRRREAEDVDGRHSRTLAMSPTQQGHLDIQDLRRALMELPCEQREVLLLTTARGFSYEDAAHICGCATGTVKSRVHRARATLGKLLAITHAEEIGPDAITISALQATE